MTAGVALLASLLAVASGPLSARVEGRAVVVARDGREGPAPIGEVDHATIGLFPLRIDPPAHLLWIGVPRQGGATGFIVRFDPGDEAPVLLLSTSLHRVNPGISSIRTASWIDDVDGDGWRDLVLYETEHSDVGPHPGATRVLRYDPEKGAFVETPALRKRVPAAARHQSRALSRAIERSAPGAEARGPLLSEWIELPSPPLPDRLSLWAGAPPFVGRRAAQVVRTRPRGQRLGGALSLVVVDLLPQPKVHQVVPLGPLGHPIATDCEGRGEEVRRTPEGLTVVWPQDAFTLVEQRLRWGASGVEKPGAPPQPVARCGEPL